jgi:hypothetical protein
MRLEKGLKMLIISSYPSRVWISDFSNDIVNAVKLYLGILFPLRYVHYRIMVLNTNTIKKLRIPYRLLT